MKISGFVLCDHPAAMFFRELIAAANSIESSIQFLRDIQVLVVECR